MSGNTCIKSLAHPGGNLTGTSNLNVEISPKRLEMLLAMVPRLSRVAVLIHPDNYSHATKLKSIQAAAQKPRVTIIPVQARNPQEIDQAFARMAKEKARRAHRRARLAFQPATAPDRGTHG